MTSDAAALMIGVRPEIFVTDLKESLSESIPIVYEEFLEGAPRLFSGESSESVAMSAGDHLLQAYAPFIVTKVAGEKYGEAVKEKVEAEKPKTPVEILRDIPAFEKMESTIRRRTSAAVERIKPNIETFMSRLDATGKIKSGMKAGSLAATAVGLTSAAMTTVSAAAEVMGLSEALINGTAIVTVGDSIRVFGQGGLLLSSATLGWTVGGQLNVFPDALRPYAPEVLQDHLDGITGAATGMTAAGLMIAVLPTASAGLGIATLPVLTAGTAAILDEHGTVLWNGGANLLMQGMGNFVGMTPKKLKID
jgi:hypothetical protein